MIKINGFESGIEEFITKFKADIIKRQKLLANSPCDALIAKGMAKNLDKNIISTSVRWKTFLSFKTTKQLKQALTDLKEEEIEIILRYRYPNPELYSFFYSTTLCSYINLAMQYISLYNTDDVSADQENIILEQVANNIFVREWIDYLKRLEDDEVREDVNDYRKIAKYTLIYLNGLIQYMFSYDLMDSSQRLLLYKKMNVRVCPYCNQQYVYHIQRNYSEGHTNGSVALGDLDHHLPKGIFSIFSLSIWNMVPACKTCNGILKHDSLEELLVPYLEGFGSDCVFRIKNLEDIAFIIKGESDPSNYAAIIGEWQIRPMLKETESGRKKARLIANHKKVFELDALYNEHQLEIRDVLLKKDVYRENYKAEIKALFAEKSISLTDDDINRILFGTSLNPLLTLL